MHVATLLVSAAKLLRTTLLIFLLLQLDGVVPKAGNDQALTQELKLHAKEHSAALNFFTDTGFATS